MLEPALRADGTRDFRKLNGLLNQPNDAMGSFASDRPAWHCALRAAPGDKTLSDEEWAQIAQDVMDRTGLSRYGAHHYPTRAESEKATRRGLDKAPRVTLRRAVSVAAASSATAEEFFARLQAAGTPVRQRYSANNPGQVTGYAVALNDDVTRTVIPSHEMIPGVGSRQD